MPRAPAPQRLRDHYLSATEKYTLGLVRFRRGAFRLAGVPLIRLAPPIPTASGWRYALAGGLLVRGDGGSLEIGWREGRLWSEVRDYRPLLPWPLFSVTQLLLHHFLSRMVLLQLRGRVPAVAAPAAPPARLAAGAIDLLVCLGLAGGRPARLVPAAVGYHLAAWRFGGQTIGGALLRQRVRAVDGSPLTLAQAMVRMAFLPAALLRLRGVHDEVAGTEVTRTWPAGS